MADIRKINSLEEYNEFIARPETLNVIKFGAQWCGPCRMLEQTMGSLGYDEVDGVLIGEIDVDDEWAEDLTAELNIRGIPVLIAYKDGSESERLVGGVSKDNLIEFFGRNK